MRRTMFDGCAGVMCRVLRSLATALNADGNGDTVRDSYGSCDPDDSNADCHGDGGRDAIHETTGDASYGLPELVHDDNNDDIDVFRGLHHDDGICLCRFVPQHARRGRRQRCTPDAPARIHGHGCRQGVLRLRVGARSRVDGWEPRRHRRVLSAASPGLSHLRLGHACAIIEVSSSEFTRRRKPSGPS